jgi:hypothetical protein
MMQVRELEAENARLHESERQTVAELGRRLTDIAAGRAAADEGRVERDLLSSAVATVQVWDRKDFMSGPVWSVDSLL